MENQPIHNYPQEFFTYIRDWSINSARVIVPILVSQLHPQSVVDVGCGDGSWLSVFAEMGVPRILGLDGAYMLDRELKIPREAFLTCDLNNPPALDQRFDLAVCLEVGEHLPESSADGLVQYLTGLSNLVIFSAAVSLQNGENHLNCQWQDYWRKKFEEVGYLPITTLRQQIWQNDDVPFFYKQNVALYVKKEVLENDPILAEEHRLSLAAPFSVIHPDYYLEVMRYLAEAKRERTFSEILTYHVKRRIRLIRKRLGLK
jgi:SAM-dependent methyltransferase